MPGIFKYMDAKVSNLRGYHRVGSVYCRKLVKHPGDVDYGWLDCEEVVFEVPAFDSPSIGDNDRVYTGELHIRGIVGMDEVQIDQEQSDV